MSFQCKYFKRYCRGKNACWKVLPTPKRHFDTSRPQWFTFWSVKSEPFDPQKRVAYQIIAKNLINRKNIIQFLYSKNFRRYCRLDKCKQKISTCNLSTAISHKVYTLGKRHYTFQNWHTNSFNLICVPFRSDQQYGSKQQKCKDNFFLESPWHFIFSPLPYIFFDIS